mmetsp:Transcript_39749/g.68154  ORF Transcript_39749/g.68154 Transcript_39749/m.68154 type:complete len:201 (-) Transcript_39749:385-987(-)
MSALRAAALRPSRALYSSCLSTPRLTSCVCSSIPVGTGALRHKRRALCSASEQYGPGSRCGGGRLSPGKDAFGPPATSSSGRVLVASAGCLKKTGSWGLSVRSILYAIPCLTNVSKSSATSAYVSSALISERATPSLDCAPTGCTPGRDRSSRWRSEPMLRTPSGGAYRTRPPCPSESSTSTFGLSARSNSTSLGVRSRS